MSRASSVSGVSTARTPYSQRYRLHLSVPREAIRAIVARIKQATKHPQASEYDVFVNVSAIARGWANYYRFAHDSSKVAGKLETVVFWLVAHYLGKKRRQSLRKVMRRHYTRDPSTDCKALFVQRPDAKESKKARYFLWHKRPKRLSLVSKEATKIQDTRPLLNTSWAKGHSMAQRLQAKAAAGNKCQNCGQSEGVLILHHQNRLRKAKLVRKGNGHVARFGYDQHGKLLCQTCHLEHHHGRTSQ